MSSIAHWPPGERPRERLLAHGAHALTDAELIAIVLGAGNARASALGQSIPNIQGRLPVAS